MPFEQQGKYMFIKLILKCFFVFGLCCVYSPTYSSNFDYYVGGSLKANFPLKFYYLGWNGDTVCYPEMNDCAQSQYKGYAWIYRVMSEMINPGLGVYAGVRVHENWRVELSLDGFLSLKSPQIEFVDIYYLKENKNPFPRRVSFWDGLTFPEVKDLTGSLTEAKYNNGNDQLISSKNSFSNLQLISGLANLYFDFPMKNKKFIPYIGVGGGYTLVRVNIGYHSRYKDASLDSKQKDVFSALALSARVKTGINYVSSNRLSYGFEAAYTMIKGISDRLSYQKHPNQKDNTIILRDIRYFTVGFHTAYLF